MAKVPARPPARRREAPASDTTEVRMRRQSETARLLPEADEASDS